MAVQVSIVQAKMAIEGMTNVSQGSSAERGQSGSFMGGSFMGNDQVRRCFLSHPLVVSSSWAAPSWATTRCAVGSCASRRGHQ